MNKTKLLDRLKFHKWDDFEVKEARKSDSMILNGYTIDDIDNETVTIYNRYLSIKKPENPFLQMNKTRFLIIPSEILFFRQTFEMKLRKNGVWLTVNRLGSPTPF
ncbi:MAG: hypothetical protein PVH61_37500 [Candidatus Aminicenantes bacterium]|jgi:hypothetical protein